MFPLWHTVKTISLFTRGHIFMGQKVKVLVYSFYSFKNILKNSVFFIFMYFFIDNADNNKRPHKIH